MILAKPRRGVTVFFEDIADGGVLNTDDGIVARVTRGQFADHAGAHRVMVAAVISAARVGEQRAVEWNWV